MSKTKRQDSKGRNLRLGESQRKDGRYVYKYTDIFGKPQFVYAWKLVPTDKTPAGKRDDISLREKEKQIKKDLDDGIDTVGGKMTVCQLYEKKNNQRKNIKRNTKIGRQYLMNALENDPLGMRAIDTVKQSDAKEWAIRMNDKPKTKNGKRELPLTERAYQALERILKNRGKAQPLVVDGYSNFLFLNREGLPKVAGNYESMVRGLIKKYNKTHKDKLPNITPHSFRHTYCTNMANKGMNPNTLQYIMGHANITMTLGYYAHGTFQSAKAELERLAS